MTDKSSIHGLRGLEADNLLAFLAMLGLLRSLEEVRPEWRARIHWTGVPITAMLTTQEEIERDEIIKAVEEGINVLCPAYGFDSNSDIVYTRDEFHKLCKKWADSPKILDLLAALGTDGCLKRDKENIVPTPFCALFGQGHQHFLLRLRGALSGKDTASSPALSRALFDEWDYSDNTPSFRWDPREDRRYALQFGDPQENKNKIGTMSGANTLASIGFGVLATVPARTGLQALGADGKRNSTIVCWPLPGVSTSLAGLKALLSHPGLFESMKGEDLAFYGLVGIARSKKIQVGKFFNFERAVIQVLKAST